MLKDTEKEEEGVRAEEEEAKQAAELKSHKYSL